MTLFDKDSFTPQPVPESVVVTVAPYGAGNRWFLPTYTLDAAEGDAERLVTEIRRHVDAIGEVAIAYEEYACPLCGRGQGTFELALDCCGATCPDCNGSGLTPHPGDAAALPYVCQSCVQGRIPDPDEWAYRHPETEVSS